MLDDVQSFDRGSKLLYGEAGISLAYLLTYLLYLRTYFTLYLRTYLLHFILTYMYVLTCFTCVLHL